MNELIRQGNEVERYSEVVQEIRLHPRRWLVTGCAGFIGSNLVEALLKIDQHVVGLDNFSTGFPHNLAEIRDAVGEEAWRRFEFVEGDIRELDTCQTLCAKVDVVLHHAAIGSVPRSIADPIATNASNVTGFLNMLVASEQTGVSRFVYAASSSTYGDHPRLPKVEDQIGRPLSPYAVSKYVNELYAQVFSQIFELQTIGLRYFNVFGRRQDPSGAYAAVIPRWISQILSGNPCVIHGDGTTSRDFCYVENVVQANLLAALAGEDATGEVYNVAVGQRTTLNHLFHLIRTGLLERRPHLPVPEAEYAPFRTGDVRHSLADISKAATHLGYHPLYSLESGLTEAIDWYVSRDPNSRGQVLSRRT